MAVNDNNNDNINDGGGDNSGMDMSKLRGKSREKWLGSNPTDPPVMVRRCGAVPPRGGVSQEDGEGVEMDILEVVMCKAEAS